MPEKSFFHKVILPLGVGWLFCLFLLLATEGAQAGTSQSAPGNTIPVVPDQNGAGRQTIYPGVTNQTIRSGGGGRPSLLLNCPQLGLHSVDMDIRLWLEGLAADYLMAVDLPVEEDPPMDNADWEMVGMYEISWPSKAVVSLMFIIESYTGGAHGNLNVFCRNYDLHNGRQLEFTDLFDDPETALKLLSAWTERELYVSMAEDAQPEMIKAGTAPELENFANLRLTPEGIVVEFEPYQVAPWAAGIQAVSVPLAALAGAGPAKRIWP